ncbi:putative MFS transporter [Aspergillus homomorphus CBS 101889]|uniref:Putative MFS transporter n=1 Tax=Aspergillus homomorphus (strain CBS 101889) TaxID=1450537 RepID=A0A395HLB8_ASPHC|nr:putative MFS transporter [Aspergillus homomorphus CBS 101889]RAL08269.1 putative MFS transporter [Aspergillus homomorphus CBS 101889]
MGPSEGKVVVETDQESNYPSLVKFDGPDDPDLPLNWSFAWKVWVTTVVAVLNLIGTIASSIFQTGSKTFMQEFHIGQEVAVLGTTFFLVGYIFGFLTFGPLSERFGRKWPMLVGITLSSLFDLMPALGHNLPTILLGRFFGGLFGVAPVAIFGGVISDCWPVAQRGVAMALAVSLVFSGPTYGPVFGGLIMGSPSLNWRWNMWVVIIVGLGATLICVVAYPETYPPVLLRQKARALRRKTGNSNLATESDKEGLSMEEIRRKYLIRPFWLITTQPILALLTLYQSFVYGVLFLFYQTYPVAFGEDRGWSITLRYLPLLGIITGVFVGAAGIVLHNQLYLRHYCHAPDGSFIPESRLPPMIVGGLLVPAGMFWFAWTAAAPNIAWPAPVCAGLLIGAGMYLLFIQGFNYIVDCYTSMANSAMGVNGAMRSVFGAVFPLFASQMVHGLGVAKTVSLLGALSAALVPVPVCFWYWGSRIRAWSSAKVLP